MPVLLPVDVFVVFRMQYSLWNLRKQGTDFPHPPVHPASTKHLVVWKFVAATDILEELSIFSGSATQLNFGSDDAGHGLKKINPDNLDEKQRKIIYALNDGIEEIDAIHANTKIDMNILLATLLELELTGKVESIGGQIYRLRVELDQPN